MEQSLRAGSEGQSRETRVGDASRREREMKHGLTLCPETTPVSGLEAEEIADSMTQSRWRLYLGLADGLRFCRTSPFPIMAPLQPAPVSAGIR